MPSATPADVLARRRQLMLNGDADGFADLFTPDAVIEFCFHGPPGTPVRLEGRVEIREYWRRHPAWPGRGGPPSAGGHTGQLGDAPAVLRGRSGSSPAPDPAPGAVVQPGRTGRLSGSSGPRTPPASGQDLRCGLRPPQNR